MWLGWQAWAAMAAVVALAATAKRWRPAVGAAAYSVYTSQAGYYLYRIASRAAGTGRAHSTTTATQRDGVTVVPVPYSQDNYAYLVINDRTREAVVVDAGDADAVQAAVQAAGAKLVAVLSTHRHWDHTGGNAALAARVPNLAIYGSTQDQIAGLTHPVADGATVEVAGLEFEAMLAPVHTLGHLLFRLQPRMGSSAPSSLFTGDALFVAGAGKYFEGTATSMQRFAAALRALPPPTLVWPGHEYAASNLKFAAAIEPDNSAVQRKLERVTALRQTGAAAVPSTIADELETNPFLRAHLPAVARAALPLAGAGSPSSEADVLQALRTAKNGFNPTKSAKSAKAAKAEL